MKRNKITAAALALALAATTGVSAYATSPVLRDKAGNMKVHFQIHTKGELLAIFKDALEIGENVAKLDISEVTPILFELVEADEMTEVVKDAIASFEIRDDVEKLDISEGVAMIAPISVTFSDDVAKLEFSTSEVTPISFELCEPGKLSAILKNLKWITVEK